MKTTRITFFSRCRNEWQLQMTAEDIFTKTIKPVDAQNLEMDLTLLVKIAQLNAEDEFSIF